MNVVETAKEHYKNAYFKDDESFNHAQVGSDEIRYKPGIFVFNGSDDDIKEWKSNFNFWPTKSGYHKGFLKTYLRFKEFYAFLSSLDSEIFLNNEMNYCIGFSRGGPQAVELARFLQTIGCKATAITFGAPRYGKSHVYDKLNHHTIINVRNRNDVVPKLLKYTFAPIPGLQQLEGRKEKFAWLKVWRWKKYHEYF